MRRLLNFCLLLVFVGAVGYLLYKAKIPPFGSRSSAVATPTVAPAPAARDTLRISVANRPEALIVNALKRLLEAENHKIDVVPFDPETSWMELAAGELDLVVAPLGEAVTAQARFQAGQFLFISGMSEGYDVILSKTDLAAGPKTLGIAGGQGGELFALQKFPDSMLVSAGTQKQLQTWLLEGAVQAAVLESAALSVELSQSGKKLGATSADGPMPTMVVLSRTLSEENSTTAARVEVLIKALESWSGLIDYLSAQPELLRSTLKQEADDLGVNLDTLLKDYRFLTPNVGRDLLLESYGDGLLKETLDLLLLARTVNLTVPDWNAVLALPVFLEAVLPGDSALVGLSPTPALLSPTPEISATPASPSTSRPGGLAGSHIFGGAAPPDPWPDSLKMKRVSKPLPFLPALTDNLVAVATASGFDAYAADGKRAFATSTGGPLLATPLADAEFFYVIQAGTLSALDEDGKIAWSFPFEGTPGNHATLTPTEVVFTLDSTAGYQVVAVSKETGVATWQASLTNPPASGPVFAESPAPAVLLLDDQGTLNAWNAQSGSVLWQSSVGKPTYLPPATLGTSMAVLDPDGAVRLLSLADGAQSWETDLGTPLAAPPTLTESLVLVPGKDTYLYALDRESGAIKGKTRLSVPLSSAAVVVEDHVYCSDELGGVHSLTLPALGLNWSKSLAKVALMGPVFSDKLWALLASDGTLLLYSRQAAAP
jgi:outer membrane protein assembly factor BamB